MLAAIPRFKLGFGAAGRIALEDYKSPALPARSYPPPRNVASLSEGKKLFG